MSENTILFDDDFWSFLTTIEQSNKPQKLTDFLARLEISEKKFFEIISFLNHLNYELEIFEENDVEFIKPSPGKHRIQFDLNLVEWLSLQAHFPLMSKLKDSPFHHVTSNRLGEIEKDNSGVDIFNAIDQFNSKEKIIEKKFGAKKDMILNLEKTIPRNQVVQIKMNDNKVIDVCAHKLLYLENDLSLIVEACLDGTLVYISLDQVASFNLAIDSFYQKQFSKTEVENFISALRDVTGKGERLILKIKDGHEIDFEPRYMYMGKPCLIKSPDGATIWAAHVEKSKEVFRWLQSIESKVVILDPPSFKEDFKTFAENNPIDQKKIA